MNFDQTHSQNRRTFLRRSAQLAFTGAALPTAINLAALGEAAAFNAGNDYKALVCIFLYGGNDQTNTIIPFDTPSYAAYQTIRGTTGSEAANGIALAKASLSSTLLDATPVSAIGTANLQYAMHPSMADLRTLFNGGQAAVLLNSGPLIKPMSKTLYKDSNRALYPLPPKLFSHNDQQSIWQSSSPEGSTVGWGGNVGDLALSSNSNSLFTCISVTGNAVFLSGDSALSYQVGRDGAVRIYSVGSNAYPFGFQSVGTSMANLLATNTARTHILENEYRIISKRAIDAETSITAAIASTAPTNNVYAAPFNSFDASNGNSLAAQLRMVARLIAARGTLGNKRQVFMVSLGGFDLHDNLLDGHTKNMERVSKAMKAFYDATKALGVADKVTSFTASEFGRTITSNGDGSDHGWGGHQIIMGDAVNGKSFYGYAPPVSITDTSDAKDQWHVGAGRLLPTTSVDQYAATLAKWFGVQPGSEMSSILPFINNFDNQSLTVNGTKIDYQTDLGFMKAP
jgi:uncharacterized protein (DUF1501 family)